MPRRGDIVLARFPFSDGSGTKLRPVLILAEVPGPFRDYVVLFISSQLSHASGEFDLVLDRSHAAFQRSGLKVSSVFRIAKIATLSDALLVGTLGQLDDIFFGEVVRRLVHLIETGQTS
ncbi:MAG: type II toxin-antitoxin system PemK/MazF family toxin [Chloroflexota bacterium]|nr:MAG: type II toxin-antitoxin system PemK/MazF family toxin [Chloroflexota bacterium]